MALSGMVYKTRECGKNVMILLAPIEDESGNASPVGQRRLVIENFTVMPLPGDIIWGSGGDAHLVRGVNNKREWHYHRKGYTTLVEAFDESNVGGFSNDIRLLTKEEELQAVRAIGKMLKPEATNGTMPEWNILMDHLDLQRQRAEKAEEELAITDKLLVERQRLLDLVPPCPEHGSCVPHAEAWVRDSIQARNLLKNILASLDIREVFGQMCIVIDNEPYTLNDEQVKFVILARALATKPE
jgi:hypothetical protein